MDIFENIPEIPNYEINKLGEIRRKYKNGNITYSKPYLENTGYYRVSIRCKAYSIHRLLAIVFIPNPDNLPLIDHIDRNRTNNKLENLRWASYSTNNDNRLKKGCICETTEKYKDKVYIYYRCYWYENNIKKSKRFKIKTEAEEFLININNNLVI